MDDGVWRVDTSASLQAALTDPGCPPLLSKVLSKYSSWQFRNGTSVERTLSSSRLMPDWTAALLALDALVMIEDDDGSHDVALEAHVHERRKGRLTALQVRRHDNVRWGEAHVGRTPSDVPIVAAYAAVRTDGEQVEDARIVLSGVSSEPVWMAEAADLLVGSPLDAKSIDDVASTVVDQVEPTGDHLGSEAYRRAMAGVLTRRALQACLERGEGHE